MEKVVSISKFKPRALEYFRQVQETSQELIVTDHGNPVLYKGEPMDAIRELRHSILKYEDPTEPVGEGEWEVLQ